MSQPTSPSAGAPTPTRVRYGVLGFACSLSMITYLDRVCFGTVAPFIQQEFGLSDTQKGMLFSAFALAYAVFEVPSGWLGDVVGPRRTLIRIVLCWSAFTALTGLIFPIPELPLLAFGAMLLVRFLFGVGEAGAYPNLARALHNWFPFRERGSAQGAVWMSGRFAGGVTAFIVLALIVRIPADGGGEVVHWRHTFWLFGVLGVVWCAVFWWWFRDHPEQHPAVNQAELELIHAEAPDPLPATLPAGGEGERLAGRFQARPGKVAAIKGPGHVAAAAAEDEPPIPDPAPPLEVAVTDSPGTAGSQDAGGAEAPAFRRDLPSHAGVPWLKLLTNLNLWTLCLMYFCAAYGWYFNITWLPGYLTREFGVDEQTWGFWTYSFMAGAPLLVGAVACLAGGLLTDGFIRRTGNRKWGRRLFGVIGHGVCALCYFAAIWAADPWVFVLCIALAAFWNDMTMGSAWASCLDIGKHYSGIVSGCMNTIGNLGGAAAGVATGLILEMHEGNSRLGWQVNFLIFAGVYVIAMLLWLRFDPTKPVVPETA
jgi:MFS family permease